MAAFPDDWTRDPANPVQAGFLGSSVIYRDGQYEAWGGMDRIYRATSPDGHSWVVDPADPVLVPGPDWYDEVEVTNPSVVVVDGVYHMWYSCIAADNDNRIAHATSPDGIVWQKDGANPVMDLGPSGSLDDSELIHPFVLYEDPLFRIWYNGHDGTTQRIVQAVSFDGVNWVRDPVAALEPGGPDEWDSFLGMMSVLPFGDSYYMFYTGGILDEETDGIDEVGIGCATSTNGSDWVKRSPSAPVLTRGEAGSWDEMAVLAPIVMATDAGFTMWYGGTADFELFSWGMATAEAPPIAVPESAHLALGQNYPNPFNPMTTIAFDLPRDLVVNLSVYDVSGRLVDEIVRGEAMARGRNEVVWQGLNVDGGEAPTGVYFYRIEAGDFVATKRMTLVR